jgi:hypothetical protein
MNEAVMKSKHVEEGDGKPGSVKKVHSATRDEHAPVAGERRSQHRVADDQKSGQGSQSALSKLKMIERRREIMKPRHDEPGEESPT